MHLFGELKGTEDYHKIQDVVDKLDGRNPDHRPKDLLPYRICEKCNLSDIYSEAFKVDCIR